MQSGADRRQMEWNNINKGDRNTFGKQEEQRAHQQALHWSVWESTVWLKGCVSRCRPLDDCTPETSPAIKHREEAWLSGEQPDDGEER